MRHVRPLRALGALLLAFTFLLAAPAAARNCTAAERTAANRELSLSEADRQASLAAHLPWGAPRPTAPATNEQLLVQRDYVIAHDGDLRVPLWTAERVEHRRLRNIERIDCFRADPRLPAGFAATPADYREPIYDQGHLAAFANQTYSVNAGLNSFIMSNMAPQTCGLNRGIWQILEGISRLWAAERGTIWILSGSIFDRDGDGRRDEDEAAVRMQSSNGAARVAVPSHFYKVIAYRRPDGRLATLSLILPHDDANPNGEAALRYLQQHVVRIAAVEAMAAVDLFPDGTEPVESETFWAFQGRQPRSLCYQMPAPAGERG